MSFLIKDLWNPAAEISLQGRSHRYGRSTSHPGEFARIPGILANSCRLPQSGFRNHEKRPDTKGIRALVRREERTLQDVRNSNLPISGRNIFGRQLSINCRCCGVSQAAFSGDIPVLLNDLSRFRCGLFARFNQPNSFLLCRRFPLRPGLNSVQFVSDAQILTNPPKLQFANPRHRCCFQQRFFLDPLFVNVGAVLTSEISYE